MSSPHIPPPPGPDVPTQPHPAPLPDDPLKGPGAPPENRANRQPTIPENPALAASGPTADPGAGPGRAADLGLTHPTPAAYFAGSSS